MGNATHLPERLLSACITSLCSRKPMALKETLFIALLVMAAVGAVITVFGLLVLAVMLAIA